MTDQLLLDVLLALIILLFGLIGFWRGAAREGLVTAGIFSGAAIADAWARPWGGDLAQLAPIRLGIAQLIVAAVALLLATTILGYGSGAVLSLPLPSLPARIAGAALAAVNGALVLRFGLRFIERFLAGASTDQVLDESSISWLLLRQSGWLLVGAAAVFGFAILMALMISKRGASGLASGSPVTVTGPEHHAVTSLQRPVRLPRQADEGKLEPASRGFDRATGTFAADVPHLRDTIPLPPERHDLGLNGGRAAQIPETWRSGAQSSRSHLAGDEWLQWPAPNPAAQPATTTPEHRGRQSTQTGQPHWQVQPPQWQPANPTDRRSAAPRLCLVCDTELGPADNFCPNCGASVT